MVQNGRRYRSDENKWVKLGNHSATIFDDEHFYIDTGSQKQPINYKFFTCVPPAGQPQNALVVADPAVGPSLTVHENPYFLMGFAVNNPNNILNATQIVSPGFTKPLYPGYQDCNKGRELRGRPQVAYDCCPGGDCTSNP
jgi:hypothetical protein